MLELNPTNARVWSMLGSRGTFGMAMLDLGAMMTDLIVMTADLATTSGLARFKKAFPDKFVNVGIAEQNMVGIAAGMAKEGNVVFVTTFATFATMRSYEQIRLNLGYMGQNVKVVGLSGGFAMGMFGNTHYGIEDLALMRAVPGLTVISPSDSSAVVKAVHAAYYHKGPVYIRLTGAMANPIVYKQEYDFEIGRAITLCEGPDLTIVATGTMVYESMVATRILKTKGLAATVVDMHTIKPLDTAVIDKACQESKLIVTVEEHGVIGGLGGAVAEYKARLVGAPRQVFIGAPDHFGKAGGYKYLLGLYGLTGEKIAERIVRELEQ
jgi:transketolase